MYDYYDYTNIEKRKVVIHYNCEKKNLSEERFEPRHLLRDQMAKWSGASLRHQTTRPL